MRKKYFNPEIEEKIRRANEEFKKWRINLLKEKLKEFKPLDEETKKLFKSLGWEYREDLSALAQALIEGF